MRKRWLLVVGPFLLFWLGAVLNILAISANHGMMPVRIPASWPVLMNDGNPISPGMILDEIHIAWYHGVHLWFLCDIFQRRGDVFSIGDVCLWVSEWITPYCIGGWLAIEWALQKQRD
jgi:hypothetical protein